MRSRKYGLIAGSSLLMLASASGAQTAATGTNAAVSESALEEIVVTARRKDESLQDVPLVVDAVTPETLAKYNIQSFQDVATLVPGLKLENNGSGFAAKASIRGANFEINSATSPTVAFYMNEAVIDANFLLQSMFDVGQIEVLRGPQGTLRGRSAPSGAITVTTHKADLSGLGGYAAVTGTDQDQIKGEGAFNLPIVADVLAVRVAGLVDDNQFDHVKSINAAADPHQHTSAERVSVTFEPSDAFSFTGTYQHLERNIRSYVQLAGSGALGAGTPGGCAIQGSTGNIPIPCPAAGYNGPVLTPSDRTGVQNQALPVTTKYDVVTAQADYRFAGQQLSYVGSYSDQKVHAFAFAYADSANMLLGGQAQKQETFTTQSQVSHELRLASEERIAGLFDYTVGAYFSLEKPEVQLPWPASYLNGAFGGGPLPNPNILDQRYLIHTDTQVAGRREERSVFGSLTWHITDQTEFTGGGRYLIAKTDEKLAVDLRSDGIIAIPAAFLGLPPGVTCAQAGLPSTYAGQCDVPSSLVAPSGTVLTNRSQNRWTPKVYSASLSHRFTDGLLAYVNYGTAWRRGPTAVGVQTTGNDPVINRFIFVQPEESKAWEVGLKSTFLDNRARVNLAVYRQKYDGFIYLTPLTAYLADNGAQPPNVQTFQFTTNVPAIVKGVDLDTSFQVTNRWNLGVAFSYADGHMEDGSIPCNDSNHDGVADNGTVTTASFVAGQHINLCTVDNSITTAPKWNANLQSEYSMPVTSALDGYVRGLYTYNPRNNRASGEGTGFTADSYGLLNLYAGIRSTGGAWDIQLFARNVTNTKKTLTYEANSEKDPVGPVNLNFGDSGYFRTSFTAPREFGITARYAF